MDRPCVITGSFIISSQGLLLTLAHVDFRLYIVRFRLEIEFFNGISSSVLPSVLPLTHLFSVLYIYTKGIRMF